MSAGARALPFELRRMCGHDSRSVDGCLTCAAADRLEKNVALLADLLAADQDYNAALRDLEEHYRRVADHGYLPARFASARILGIHFVDAQIRREKAIERAGGHAIDTTAIDPDHAAMLRDSIAQPLDDKPTASPASED